MNPTTKKLCALMLGLLSTGSIAACSATISEDQLPDDGSSSAPLCTDADTTLAFEFTVDASAWPLDAEEDPFGEIPSTRTVAATCSVVALEQGVGTARLELSCSGGEVTDGPIVITLSGAPQDLSIPMEVGDVVELDSYEQSDGHHVRSGSWFVIHDDAGSELLLSAIDYDAVGQAGDRMAPIALDVNESICDSPCEFDCYEPHRLGLTVEGLDGEQQVVLDGSREAVGAYDVVVGKAHKYTCLNCPWDFNVLIASR